MNKFSSSGGPDEYVVDWPEFRYEAKDGSLMLFDVSLPKWPPDERLGRMTHAQMIGIIMAVAEINDQYPGLAMRCNIFHELPDARRYLGSLAVIWYAD